MARIKRLTAAQKRRLVEFRAEYLAHGLSTAAADRPRAEAAFARAYRRIGRDPVPVIWVDSPLTASLAVALLRKDASIDASLWDSLSNSLGAGLSNSLRASLSNSLGAGLSNSLWASLWASLRASLRDSLWASLRDSLRASLRDSLSDSLWASLRDSLWDSLWASLRDSLWDSLRDSRINPSYTYWWGGQDLYWIAYYLFCAEIGTTYSNDTADGLDIMHEIGLSCGWWYPRDGVIIACERPEVIRMDDRQRLHCDAGPAVRHRDGWEIYAIHGTRVPARIVTDPDSITVAEIDAESNAEIRRVMMERYGTARYICDSGADLIADDPVHGRLFRKSRGGDSDVVMLHVKCPTTEPDGTVREFWLRVHPECRPMRVNADGTMWLGEPQPLTPRNARASTFGLTGEAFEHLAEAA